MLRWNVNEAKPNNEPGASSDPKIDICRGLIPLFGEVHKACPLPNNGILNMNG